MYLVLYITVYKYIWKYLLFMEKEINTNLFTCVFFTAVALKFNSYTSVKYVFLKRCPWFYADCWFTKLSNKKLEKAQLVEEMYQIEVKAA